MSVGLVKHIVMCTNNPYHGQLINIDKITWLVPVSCLYIIYNSAGLITMSYTVISYKHLNHVSTVWIQFHRWNRICTFCLSLQHSGSCSLLGHDCECVHRIQFLRKCKKSYFLRCKGQSNAKIILKMVLYTTNNIVIIFMWGNAHWFVSYASPKYHMEQHQRSTSNFVPS